MLLLRQLHIGASTVDGIGKPVIVGGVDDLNSKRHSITVLRFPLAFQNHPIEGKRQGFSCGIWSRLIGS